MNVTPHETAELRPELADQAPDQAQYDEWVKHKVAMARADDRPALTIAEARKRLHDRLDSLDHV